MQYHLVAAAAIALAGCGSYDTMSPASDTTATAAYSSAARHHHSGQEPRRELPLQELASAMSNAARYHDVRKALADGYRDTGIVLPNMGRHFLKESLLDARFEADRPELLVYTPDSTVLVALEYAVPIGLSPNAPEGFTGQADEWVQFGGSLWTLHAWVWKDNPDGLFNPTNERVP
jgi:hypothetical protein